MTFYCLGFLFTTDLSSVLLIRKARPSWQAGKLNGIGGKVEAGETAFMAMLRECREETGLATYRQEWRHFAIMSGPGFEVDCFAGVCVDLDKAQGTKDEPLELWEVILLHSGRREMVDGLQWLVPLASDHLRDGQPARVAVRYSAWPVAKAGQTGGCEAVKTASK